MKTYLECIPCIIKFSLAAIRLVTADSAVQEKIIRKVLATLSQADYHLSPPELTQTVFDQIQLHFGDVDPYHDAKQRFNRHCLKLLPELRARVRQSADPFEAALRMSIAGNIIDMASNAAIHEDDVHHTITECLQATLYEDKDIVQLRKEIKPAKSILILGDNAGEIVFDQLLIGQMPAEKVTYAVKGAPILNDATMEDALETGLTEQVKVIDNGSGMPGTLLKTCSDEFKTAFQQASVVIAKGQANYETLSSTDRDIYFILKIKCPVIARDIGYRHGDCLVLKNAHIQSKR